jgi:hypothetical protein
MLRILQKITNYSKSNSRIWKKIRKIRNRKYKILENFIWMKLRIWKKNMRIILKAWKTDIRLD